MKRTLSLFVFLMVLNHGYGAVKPANPDNYTAVLASLVPGDTMVLAPGFYTRRLSLWDRRGLPGKPIVIIGAEDNSSVFLANNGSNTVTLRNSAYIIIKNLTLDGQNLNYINGVNAQGDYCHNIILDNLRIIRHGGTVRDNQTVGISTKCPAWDWIIRNCVIDEAGTGMYLGNSDGRLPFVNGIIENNLITNSQGYNIEIKRQNENLRNVPGMTLNGKTILRYNVFSKKENANGGAFARPNVLFGGLPASGDGSEDRYEVYGNLFYQNPTDVLLQFTGNVAVYNNIFYNDMGTSAMAIRTHDSRRPRKVSVFHNTILVNGANGINFSGLDPAFTDFQHCYGNAVFVSGSAVNNAPVNSGNHLTGTYANAATYLSNVTSTLPGLDAYPKLPLTGDEVDSSPFQIYTDWNKDFDGNKFNWSYRGAYSGEGVNPGWKPDLVKRPPLIEDVVLPNVVTRDIVVTLGSNGIVTITPDMVDNGSTDNQGIASYSLSQSTFDCSDIGENTVTLTVTDKNSNTASATATVKVIGVNPVASIAVSREDNTYTAAEDNVIFLGYGAQSLTLTASNSTSDAEATSYLWSPETDLSNATTAETVFTPQAAGVYTYMVTATNEYGCTANSQITITVVDARCEAGGSGKADKVLVCHGGKNLCVAPEAVEAHLMHGCTLAACLGDSSNDADMGLSIYPNPAANTARIEVGIAPGGTYSLELYDIITGTLIAKIAEGRLEDDAARSYQVDTSFLAEGIYIVKLKAGDRLSIHRLEVSR